MKPEQWTRVKVIVADALELPSADRPAFVIRSCEGDDALRHEVESLLAAADDDDSVPGARRAVESASRSAAAEHDAAQRTALEQALSAQYEILRPLGRGGMGFVYLARERELERFVAIKVLRQEVAAAAEGRERFKREARVAAQLAHPGIVPLHAFGEVAGMAYFGMAYARGETLDDRLRAEKQVPWHEALRMLVDLADALDAAHRHGVVHRDIKPSNILLDDESGRVMLADFGIAKRTDADDPMLATGAVVGTPDYMSPEQVQGARDLDGRSDIYSLGAVAYRMLTGREPFEGPDAPTVMRRRLTEDPPRIRSVAPSVPDELADVVQRALMRDRGARWSNARELKQALLRAGENAAALLPEPVRDLPSFGAYAVFWAAVWSAFAIVPARPRSEAAILLLIAFLVPAGLALHVWNVGRPGLTPMELARVASWPPEWWGMWWPGSLRRPTDLWIRLPRAARVVRAVLSAFFVLVPGLVLTRQWLETSGRLDAADWQEWFVSAQIAAVATTAVVVIWALAWARRNQLTVSESARLLFGATVTSSFWESRQVARLLTTAQDGPAGTR